MGRTLTPERMDAPDAPREELRAALGYLRFVNRRLGGSKALIRCLERFSPRWPRDRAVTLLDVGAGSGDVAQAARAWAAQRGFDLRVTVVDQHVETVRVARERVGGDAGIEVVEADALTLTDRFAVGSFDYAHAGLFLHHLNDVQALTMLRVMDRLTRAGVIWSDLVRSRVMEAAVALSIRGQAPMVRHDAVVSVQAGFTRREALDMAARLDMRWLRWRREPLLYRFVMAGEKPEAWR
jgi:SAM-dependent methyltransferase